MDWNNSIDGMNIFIMGKAGSGKDTIAAMLKDGYFYETFALADPIRKEFAKYFPGCNPRVNRDKLIEIGQTYKNLYGKDVWVRRLYDDILSFHSIQPNPVVITDGRYQVEYDYYVTKLGYQPLRIYCDDDIRYDRLMKRDGTLQKDALLKESIELDNANAYTIDNSRDLGYTARQLKAFIRNLGR